jgi:hypothetical protein
LPPILAKQKEEESTYDGPYRPTERDVMFQDPDAQLSSSEFSYFSPFNPYPGFYGAAAGGQISRYQEGGAVEERAVRMPSEVNRGGREFNYNFRPVEIDTSSNQQSSGAEAISRILGSKGGKGGRSTSDGAPAGMSAKDAKKFGYDKYTNLSNFKYNPRTQKLERMAAGGLAALAEGGELLEDGSFVIDARTVAELGNGSSEAGQELLAQIGGRPVKGPGDVVSDSIPATIEGQQAAAVARDEVILDPEAVRRIGEGDMDEGARRLYELMNQAHKARKSAKRGEDTGVGLGALEQAMA